MKKFYFNELTEGKQIFENGFIDGEFWDKYLLAKYLRTQLGYGETKILSEIEKYSIKQNPYFESNYKNRENTKKIVRMAMKQTKMMNAEPVTITKKELDYINSIEDFDARKTLFVMLVFARAKKQRTKDQNGKLYIDDGYMKQIKKLVGFRPGMTDFFGGPIHNLNKLGAIDSFLHVYKKDLMHTFVILMADEEPSDVALTVDNFEDIVSFLPVLCPKCGKPMDKKPTKKRDICSDCYKIQRRENVKNNVRKFRNQI